MRQFIVSLAIPDMIKKSNRYSNPQGVIDHSDSKRYASQSDNIISAEFSMKLLNLSVLNLSIVILCCYGCEPHYDSESHWEEGAMGVLRQGLTVGEAGGCSTSIVNALSEQLIDEINCLRPGTLRSVSYTHLTLPTIYSV